jgi:anaerobic ribonucleoside-triphosphate reductase activating protein
MRVAGIIQDSIVDGPGLRFVLFAQGCPRSCEGCHNPDSQDPDKGKVMPSGEIIDIMKKNPLTDGLTLSGGEPFMQPGECADIAEAARGSGLDVWTYTGYLFEELLDMSEADADIERLLLSTDILVDGPFIMAQKTYDKNWRGSANQRLIDVGKSLAEGKTVLFAE